MVTRPMPGARRAMCCRFDHSPSPSPYPPPTRGGGSFHLRDGPLPRRSVLAGLVATGAAGMCMGGIATPSPAAAPVPVRQDISRLPPARLAALEAAIGEMQSRSRRDPADPKGWRVNALAHTHVCSTVSNADLAQVHGCWWFLPWHRAFLAVTEWKLRALSGDPGLALPYWNWSNDRRIPAAFARPGSALADAVRYTADRDLRGVEVDHLMFDPARAPLGVAGLEARSFTARTPEAIPASFGGMAKPNAGGWHGRSRMETVPHNAIHNYVGGEAADGSVGDMTELAGAALDPVFFAHHGNLDRLWEIWRQDPARKATEPADREFTEKRFLFPWLDGTIIEVAMADVLDTRRLGYAYDSLSVLRDGAVPAGDAALPDAAGRRLAHAVLNVPAGGARYALRIGGVEPGDRPLSVEICLGRAGDAASLISVGALAMGIAHGPAVFPDTAPLFDVTAAVHALGTPTVEVAVLPLALGVGQRSWPAFRFSGMEIVAADV
jgi:Common central domain of tyrosinase